MKQELLYDDAGLIELEATADGRFATGRGEVRRVLTPADRKVEIVEFDAGVPLVHVKSALGYPAYYPLHPARIESPLEAVLMDLDGTTVHSEDFWIWVIEQTTAAVLGEPKFELEEADLPHVSGHSVSEHLQHCMSKYCPERTVEDARVHYFEITRREMKAILDGGGRADAFHPTPGLKPFLLELKRRGLKLGLVTSGLHEKAWPEIVAAFRQLDLGDPAEFYDAIVTAGFPLQPGAAGTLGELSPKPHPWLYAETARVGLGIPFERRADVIGVEDSSAGVLSVRLAGFACLGLGGGNIAASGSAGFCSAQVDSLEALLETLDSISA